MSSWLAEREAGRCWDTATCFLCGRRRREIKGDCDVSRLCPVVGTFVPTITKLKGPLARSKTAIRTDKYAGIVEPRDAGDQTQ